MDFICFIGLMLIISIGIGFTALLAREKCPMPGGQQCEEGCDGRCRYQVVMDQSGLPFDVDSAEDNCPHNVCPDQVRPSPGEDDDDVPAINQMTDAELRERVRQTRIRRSLHQFDNHRSGPHPPGVNHLRLEQ